MDRRLATLAVAVGWRALAQVEMAQAPDARRILANLIGFPTVSRDSNLALVDWVERYLNDLGVAAHRVCNAEGTKASLYASVGPQVEGGVILSGHTDVVPVDGQKWTSDPWTLTERGGRFYGRGTCDMKSFDALALAAVPMALGARLRRPLQIALSYDEEIGCTGAPPMIAAMARHLPRAAAVVVGEPSKMKVVTGHKGGHGFRCVVTGYEAHSSMLHKSVSAVMTAARLVNWANEFNDRCRTALPTATAAMFDPPFTMAHVGTIAGGTANNITAGECRFDIGFRVVPDEDAEARAAEFRNEATRIAAEIRAIRPEAGIRVEEAYFVPPLRPEPSGTAEVLVRRLTGDNATHVVSYGTEAGQFQAAGYSTVVCGPGDIAQAHQPDEFIEISEFEVGAAFMKRLVADLER